MILTAMVLVCGLILAINSGNQSIVLSDDQEQYRYRNNSGNGLTIQWIGTAEGSDKAFQSLKTMCDEINIVSGGRLVLDFKPVGELCPQGEVFEAVDQGNIDFAVCDLISLDSYYPVNQIIANRGAGMSPMEKYQWLISGDGTELLQQTVADSNIYVVPGGGLITTPETFLCSGVPIIEPTDLEDLKIRCAGDMGVVLDRMGANTMFLPGSQIYDAMEMGGGMEDGIDAFEYGSAYLDRTMAFYEVAEYMYLSGVRVNGDFMPLIVYQVRWDELSADLRILIEKISREHVTKYYGELCQCDLEALWFFENYGCTVEQLSNDVEQAFLTEAEIFYDEKAIDYPGLYADILESQREFQENFRAVWPRP